METAASTEESIPAVSIVIPNWNGAALLERNLPHAIAAARAHPAPCEVIVVNDGSIDESAAVALRLGARLIEHRTNRGFGAACLSGAQQARHELVFLLNSDARPDANAFVPLCHPFRDPTTFATAPLVLDANGSANAISLRIPYLKRGRFRYRDHDLGQPATDPGHLPWLTLFPLGGAILLRRQHFLEIGGFDPLFHPFYYEDIDLGLCAWRRGLHCIVVPESRVTHDGGGTIERAFPKLRVRVIRKRNRVLFHCKNLTMRSDLLRYAAGQVFRSVANLVRLDATELLGTCAALPRLRAALAARRAEREAAVLSEAEIVRVIQERWQHNLETASRLAMERTR